jgi:hypothetical protein
LQIPRRDNVSAVLHIAIMTAGHKTNSNLDKAKKANVPSKVHQKGVSHRTSGIGAVANRESIGMPIVRKVISGFDLKRINDGNIALIWGVADAVFAWEKQVMILGEPSEEDRKQHKSTIDFLLKVIKPLAKFSDDKRLEMLQIRLEDSIGMFYGMTEEAADKALSVFK